MAHARVQECLTTGCNILSRQIFFSRDSSQPLCLTFLSKCRRLSIKPGKVFIFFFLALIDGGFEGLILMLLCCRVRCNPHQSAVKENKSKTNKKKERNPVASLRLPALPTQTQKCGERHDWPVWNMKRSGDKPRRRSSALGVGAGAVLSPRSDRAKNGLRNICERPSLQRANMALKDKAGSNVDGSLSDK